MTSKRVKNAHVWTRDPHDWYVEPSRVTAQLCAVEHFQGSICDPSCGQGNIVTGLHAAGYPDAYGTDLIARTTAPWFLGVSDFLGDGMGLCGAANYVSNPPFYRAKGAEACIRRALHLATGKVCAFLDARFIFSETRAKSLYVEHPPSRVWIVTPRVSCPPGQFLLDGGKAEGGTPDFVWIVWDKATPPGAGTQLGWLR